MSDLKGLRDPSSFRSWVRRIATREAIRDPGLRRDGASVLAELPADQRVILVLRDLEGLSEAEAAAELDIARGTIKSRLHRAREAFRKRWPS